MSLAPVVLSVDLEHVTGYNLSIEAEIEATTSLFQFWRRWRYEIHTKFRDETEWTHWYLHDGTAMSLRGAVHKAYEDMEEVVRHITDKYLIDPEKIIMRLEEE